VTIEVGLRRIELLGRHGVSDEERAKPQRLVFDVSLVLRADDAALSDRLEDTVDYREILECVRDVCERREYRLLEALAGGVVDELRRRFQPREISVSVDKPDRPLKAAGWAGVTVRWP
jgi:dihydroneopterin aldolase